MHINLRDNSRQSIVGVPAETAEALTGMAERTVGELIDENPGLLVFPPNLLRDGDRQGLSEQPVFTARRGADGSLELTTGNVMGFIGVGGAEVDILSRFTQGDTSDDDYFLHYMLQRVFSFSLYKWEHGTARDRAGFDWRFYFLPVLLQEALRQGIYKEYRSYRYNDARIKGPVDVPRHIRANVPFRGRVAYNRREYSADNPVTELVRHTLEYMHAHPVGSALLRGNAELREAEAQIASATPAYSKHERGAVLARNMAKPVRHPYFSRWAPLQALCIQILRREALRYAQADAGKIHGILFDGAWLWEEYLHTVFREYGLGLKHPRNREGEFPLHLARLGGRPEFGRCPDFYKESAEGGVVLDAKYKRYIDTREDVNQLVTYLYRLRGRCGAFVLPGDEPDLHYDLEGYGARLGVIRHCIPRQEAAFPDFLAFISNREEDLVQRLRELLRCI